MSPAKYPAHDPVSNRFVIHPYLSVVRLYGNLWNCRGEHLLRRSDEERAHLIKGTDRNGGRERQPPRGNPGLAAAVMPTAYRQADARVTSGSFEEHDCAPHPFDVMALYALYQNVQR